MKSLSDEVRQFCSAHHLRLNTDLGQHFLIDEEVLRRIVEAAEIAPGETIVEIGPGIGILTRELLRKGTRVTAIELDERMIPLLEQFVAKHPPLPQAGEGWGERAEKKLNVIHSNALHAEMPQIPYKVVANIPYHITSPLLRHLFLESKRTPMSLTLLIQREVAEKICDAKDAGMLTILVALFGKPNLVTTVPPDSFLPPPKVDSAILHITCFTKPLAEPEIIDRIFRLTKIAFGQKRKMLRNTLGAFQGGMERLAGLGIAQDRRPQTLSIEEWIALARAEPEDGSR